MKIWNRAIVYIEILLLIFCLTACGKASGYMAEKVQAGSVVNWIKNTHIPAAKIGMWEKTGNTEESTDDWGLELENEEDTTPMSQKYTYKGEAVLTKDNIEKTMKYFLTIVTLSSLENLPLTERFFNECLAHPEYFPYAEKDDILRKESFRLVFWGIREDGKCVCLCQFNPTNDYTPEGSFYYVVMDLEDERIDSMEVTLVEKYDPTEVW